MLLQLHERARIMRYNNRIVGIRTDIDRILALCKFDDS